MQNDFEIAFLVVIIIIKKKQIPQKNSGILTGLFSAVKLNILIWCELIQILVRKWDVAELTC